MKTVRLVTKQISELAAGVEFRRLEDLGSSFPWCCKAESGYKDPTGRTLDDLSSEAIVFIHEG